MSAKILYSGYITVAGQLGAVSITTPSRIWVPTISIIDGHDSRKGHMARHGS